MEELGINLVETVASEDDPTAEDNAESLFPTAVVMGNSLAASTVKAETHTFVPFIPAVLPETTAATTVVTHLMAAAGELSTEEATKLETITEEEEEAGVEDIPPTEREHGGEAEFKEHVTNGEPSC